MCYLLTKFLFLGIRQSIMYHQIINTEIIAMKENPILKFVDKSTKKK